MPTVEEMLKIAKGLRTKDQVKLYFRKYRRSKNQVRRRTALRSTMYGGSRQPFPTSRPRAGTSLTRVACCVAPQAGAEEDSDTEQEARHKERPARQPAASQLLQPRSDLPLATLTALQELAAMPLQLPWLPGGLPFAEGLPLLPPGFMLPSAAPSCLAAPSAMDCDGRNDSSCEDQADSRSHGPCASETTSAATAAEAAAHSVARVAGLQLGYEAHAGPGASSLGHATAHTSPDGSAGGAPLSDCPAPPGSSGAPDTGGLAHGRGPASRRYVRAARTTGGGAAPHALHGAASAPPPVPPPPQPELSGAEVAPCAPHAPPAWSQQPSLSGAALDAQVGSAAAVAQRRAAHTFGGYGAQPSAPCPRPPTASAGGVPPYPGHPAMPPTWTHAPYGYAAYHPVAYPGYAPVHAYPPPPYGHRYPTGPFAPPPMQQQPLPPQGAPGQVPRAHTAGGHPPAPMYVGAVPPPHAHAHAQYGAPPLYAHTAYMHAYAHPYGPPPPYGAAEWGPHAWGLAPPGPPAPCAGQADVAQECAARAEPAACQVAAQPCAAGAAPAPLEAPTPAPLRPSGLAASGGGACCETTPLPLSVMAGLEAALGQCPLESPLHSAQFADVFGGDLDWLGLGASDDEEAGRPPRAPADGELLQALLARRRSALGADPRRSSAAGAHPAAAGAGPTPLACKVEGGAADGGAVGGLPALPSDTLQAMFGHWLARRLTRSSGGGAPRERPLQPGGEAAALEALSPLTAEAKPQAGGPGVAQLRITVISDDVFSAAPPPHAHMELRREPTLAPGELPAAAPQQA
jgi:hypothetical protein